MFGNWNDVLNGLHKNSGELDVRNLRAKFAAMPFLELATLGEIRIAPPIQRLFLPGFLYTKPYIFQYLVPGKRRKKRIDK